MLKSSAPSVIRLRGVRHNNLKNFDLDLPLNQLIVITGLSGSGKSSLAFDTLFAEGQRRYIETFSPYARQFFDRMDKPQVDSIEGIPPAIAIEQRNAVRTTRSTVGTMTEICDFMKMLWPHISQLHCRQCGQLVRKDSPQSIWNSLAAKGPAPERSSGGKLDYLITFDLPLSEKLSLGESLALIAKQGYQRLLIDGEIVRMEQAVSRLTPHISAATRRASRVESLTVIQDRFGPAQSNRARFIEACEQAYHFGKGKLAIRELPLTRESAYIDANTIADKRFALSATKERGAGQGEGQPNERRSFGNDPLFPFVPRGEGEHVRREGTLATHRFSNRLHCAQCNIEYRDPSPALFSFNNPVGACPTCRGFGRIISIDYDRALPDRSKTLADGVVKPWQTGHGLESQNDLLRMCRHFGIPTNVPFEKLPKKWQDFVIEGEPDYGTNEDHQWPRAWYGVKGYFRWLESKAYKMHVRVLLSRYRAYTPCPDCRGKRFQPESLLYLVAIPTATRNQDPDLGSRARSLTLADFYQLPIRDALQFIQAVARDRRPQPHDPISLILAEATSRLSYLNEVGLGYLTLDRPTRSLSGGETERVSLTTCLGTRLVNTLFVLDEPSVGLHPRDTDRLVRILQQLRNAGNTVVVVEHEPSVMAAGDQLIDLGPGHGASGGEVVFQGSYRALLRARHSLTGQYLSGRTQIEIPSRRPVGAGQGTRPPLYANTEQFGYRPLMLNDARSSRVDRSDSNTFLRLAHVTKHNLSDLSIEIPLGRFVCVTGVSGSGKTTLVREVLLPALQIKLNAARSNIKASDRLASEEPGEDIAGGSSATHPTVLEGWKSLGQVMLVDQSILGKTPRSNPAVYIGAFDDIREFFAQSEPARQRGLSASAFSFNSGQGQCQRCRGAGFEKIEMQFLSDVFIRCPECNGRRYRRHILDVRVAVPGIVSRATKHNIARLGRRRASPSHALSSKMESQSLITNRSSPSKSIADLLESTVEEAIAFLSAFPDSRPAQRAAESLGLVAEIGLGYLKLGQPINTLSGGESQRLKLVRHLAESTGAGAAGRDSSASSSWAMPDVSRAKCDAVDLNPGSSTLFLFDEPTTGLHFEDVRVLLKVFQRLVDAGNSVVVIEHNLEVIKSADWVIDLGPDAGDQGGQLVAEGTPEQIVECAASHTGRALRQVLKAPRSPVTCVRA